MTAGDLPVDDENPTREIMEAGFPGPRQIPEVMAAMEALAERCDADEADLTTAFDTALGLMLEIRVPRMPTNREELRAMIAASRDNTEGMETAAAFAALENHRKAFSVALTLYRESIARRHWGQAADMLAATGEHSLIRWGQDPFGRDPAAPDGDRSIQDDAAASALAAMLRAHVERPQTWMR